MAVTNTGIVERVITGVHDANFVRPLGDEEITNGDFSDGISNWALVGGGQETVVDGQLILRNIGRVKQLNVVDTNKTYIGKIIISGLTIGSLDFYIGSTDVLTISTNGTHTFLVSNPSDAVIYIYDNGDGWDGSIDSVSIKEVLVSRESTATNTGAVERSITGVHDANFVRPLGDELVVNGTFDSNINFWNKGGGNVNPLSWDNGKIKITNDVAQLNSARRTTATEIGKTYKVSADVNSTNGLTPRLASSNPTAGLVGTLGTIETLTYTFIATSTSSQIELFNWQNTIDKYNLWDNVSVKEMLVTRESTATNTGIVERGVTGVNESDLWLDAESTSVVNNTGIVERPIVGVNESDEMFPDNTISNIVNIAGLISSLIADLKARATTFENEDATEQILINLQKC